MLAEKEKTVEDVNLSFSYVTNVGTKKLYYHLDQVSSIHVLDLFLGNLGLLIICLDVL